MQEDFLWEFLTADDDITIIDSFVKANSVINNPCYKNIMCSISGGSDSDVILDLIHKVDVNKKVKYVWFNTGLEYQATKDHLKHLEEKYNIEIIRERAIKPIPVTCKQDGEPFLSKQVSNMISRLQKHNFKYEDKTFDELIKEYPNCRSSLKWWCNVNDINTNGFSRFNIDYNKYLKEFLIKNPPQFKISSKCCDYAKKNVSKMLVKNYDVDLMIIGIRKAEGGVRASAYKNCISINDDNVDNYRPIFWYKDKNKINYENKFNITHSECYTKYGFKRTGCCCCPYGRDLEWELETTKLFEPNLYKAVNNVFKNSYEYTKQYREFVQMMKAQEEENKTKAKGQLSLFDFM